MTAIPQFSASVVRLESAPRRDSMPFQAYSDSIEKRTGLTAGQLLAAARARGFDRPGTDPHAVAVWLKDDYDLGRRYAQALMSALRADIAS
jgi:hypothetical protein